jgi:hypothetical protein
VFKAGVALADFHLERCWLVLGVLAGFGVLAGWHDVRKKVGLQWIETPTSFHQSLSSGHCEVVGEARLGLTCEAERCTRMFTSLWLLAFIVWGSICIYSYLNLSTTWSLVTLHVGNMATMPALSISPACLHRSRFPHVKASHARIPLSEYA